MQRGRLTLLAVLAVIASCGPDDASTPAPPPVATGTPTVPVAGSTCAAGAIAASVPLYTGCLSTAAKTRLATDYSVRIMDRTIMQPHGGFDPRYYPGEVIASVSALGRERNDAQLQAWANDRLVELQATVDAGNGFLLWPDPVDGAPTFGELAQSRLVLSMALIHRATGDTTARAVAIRAFAALDSLPLDTAISSVTGRTYRLPFYAYHDISRPVGLSRRTLDPNHDAALAAAYFAMARFVLQDPPAIAAAREKGLAYLMAATDLALPGACMPLADTPDYRGSCDTRYNGYWSFLLELIEHWEPGIGAKDAVDRQFAFTRQDVIAFRTRRTYPDAVSGPYPDPVEPLLWLPTAARNLSSADFQSLADRTNTLLAQGDSSAWPRGNLYPAFYR